MRAPLLLASLAVLVAAAGCSGSPRSASVASEASSPAAAATSAGAEAPPPSPSAPPSAAPTPVVVEGDGSLTVVPGITVASGAGVPTAYVVEVEGGLGVDPRAFAADVDRVLADPRSWGRDGRLALHRVAGGDVAFRVVLASPRTVDRLCAPLDTRGYFSCASRGRAVLNVERWLKGARTYDGRMPQYRQYLVNHEVGHLLGHSHEACPAPGAPAPVMLQQTKSLGGCAHNPWPHP